MSSADIGDEAPDFTLEGSTPDGQRSYTLSEFRGRPVVLAFYPGDDSPVCTAQLCSYQDEFAKFTELDAVVLGISPQGIESHRKFAARNGIEFPLLADPNKEIAKLYDIATLFGIRRAVFVVDGGGRIRWKHVAKVGLTFQDTTTITRVLRGLAGTAAPGTS